MILLVFEGKKREPKLFTAIEQLGLFKPGSIICSFCSDIQSLCKRVKELEDGAEGTVDMVQLLQRARKDDSNDPIHSVTSDRISEIYLFFDSDLHNSRYPLNEQRERLDGLLSLLGDELEYGKLYISYPMIEAVRYTRELPDTEFGDYCVSIPDCNSTSAYKTITTSPKTTVSTSSSMVVSTSPTKSPTVSPLPVDSPQSFSQHSPCSCPCS